jgi:hypothetical protein
MSEKRVY